MLYFKQTKRRIICLFLVLIYVFIFSVSETASLMSYAYSPTDNIPTINVFSLKDNNCVASGTSFSSTITIKSKEERYSIRVNSVDAKIKYYQNDTDVLSTVFVESSVVNSICDTTGKTFQVKGNIPENSAGLICYECSYDLIDKNGEIVYTDLTGYGYGFVSANGQQIGELGSYSGEPERPGDRYCFGHFDMINSLYVQTTNIVLTSNQETLQNATAGTGSVDKSFTLSGDYPDTITVRDLHWDYVEMYGEGSVDTIWFEMNSMTSGYFNFSINYDGLHWFDVEMYYRDDAEKLLIEDKLSDYLNNGLEKRYYTEESWNNYLLELEKLALVALAIPSPTYAFKCACENVSELVESTSIEEAKENLVIDEADYSEVIKVYNEFCLIKDDRISVSTYNAESSTIGSKKVRMYAQDSVDEIESYVMGIDRTLRRYQQDIVDGYADMIRQMTDELVLQGAVYEYIDIAISESQSIDRLKYTDETWSAYENAILSGENIERNLNIDQQSIIDEALCNIVSAKNGLELIKNTAHNLVKVEANPSTCVSKGNIEYYSCVDCGKLFKDENCENEIVLADVVTDFSNHVWGDWIEVDSQTKERECTVCGEKERNENKVFDLSLLSILRGTASMKSYKGTDCIAITMAEGRTMTGLYKDMADGGTVELVDIFGNIQDRANDYVAYQSQNATNPVATMKVTYADGTVETYPVVFELYEMEREIDLDISKSIRPIRGKASLAEDAKGEYILVEMLEGQSSVGVYKATTDGSVTVTLLDADGMFTEQEKLYIFYGSQNTFNPEGRLTVTEADGTVTVCRVVFKMYEMDPYVNVAKGLRPVRGAVTFDADGTIRIKMTSGQKSVGLYKTMANGATFEIEDANGKITNNPSSVMFYITNNTANITATTVFTLPDGTTKEQKIIFDMGLAENPDPLVYLNAVRGVASYQNDGTEDYIEVKANALSTGVGLYKDCLVKYTITDADGTLTENDSRYYIYKSQNPDGLTANINFLQSDGSYRTYKVKFVF